MTELLSTSDAPRTAESVDVVLARMDGKLDRVFDKVADAIPRIGRLEERADALENVTLILTKNAEAEEAKKIALALALKEADETRRNQSEQSWSPMQKFFTAVGFIVGLITLGLYFYSVFK